jgi:hypothetical protein
MPMLGNNGGLIGARRVPTVSAAPGVWTLGEQVVARRAGIWPTVAANRYWRMDAFASTELANDSFDLTEIRFWDDGTLVSSGITCTSNLTFGIGAASLIVDGTTNQSNRALLAPWSAVRSSARLDFDFGQIRLISHIEIRSLYAQPRFPASFVLSSSAVNGSGYSTVSTVTVGTSFSNIGSNVWSSGQVALT